MSQYCDRNNIVRLLTDQFSVISCSPLESSLVSKQNIIKSIRVLDSTTQLYASQISIAHTY